MTNTSHPRERLRAAFLACYHLFGGSPREVADAIREPMRVATSALGELEDLGLVHSEHVNEDRRAKRGRTGDGRWREASWFSIPTHDNATEEEALAAFEARLAQ